MKNSCRIGNWKQYNKSLINRGSITFGFSEEAIKNWKAKRNKKHFSRPLVYSNLAIETASIIRFIYHLPLRATQGFMFSLASILRLKISIPSYTQIEVLSEVEKQLLIIPQDSKGFGSILAFLTGLNLNIYPHSNAPKLSS